MKHLLKNTTIDGFTFELNGDFYECRGTTYYDDDNDQIPDPKLQKSAEKLKDYLFKSGYNVCIEHGEKGWIEVYVSL